MKLIASENHYQKKVWEQNRIELEMKHETARMTPAELEAEEKRMNRCLDRAFQKYEEHQATTVCKPDLWRRWRFERATRLALDFAKYSEFNVRIEADEVKGLIKMRGDMILLDASSEYGRKQRQQLLLLLRWAESILIGVTEEYGVDFIDLDLMYKLVGECRKR